MPDDTALEVFSTSLVKTVCDRSLTPNEEIGQNFLVDWDVARREVALADIDGSDTVLEIGPGLGVLTVLLAERAGRTVAIEKDERLEPMLTHVGERRENLEVTYADALDVDLGGFEFDTVVANLPFGVSLPIIFELFDAEFETAVLLIQKELADRITRSPGESGYNRLSVQLSRTANVERAFDVPADAFYPAPDVDGAVVRIERVEPEFDVPSDEFFRTLLMFLFSQRERTIHQALFQLVSIDAPVDISTADMTRAREALGDVAETEVAAASPREFGAVAEFLRQQYGDGALDAFEAYFDEHDLYKRARGEND